MNAQDLIKLLQQSLENNVSVPHEVTQEIILVLEFNCDFMLDGKWSLVYTPPDSWMSDEWNTNNAWTVARMEAPFCDSTGLRRWSGSTPLNAYKNAITSLELT